MIKKLLELLQAKPAAEERSGWDEEFGELKSVDELKKKRGILCSTVTKATNAICSTIRDARRSPEQIDQGKLEKQAVELGKAYNRLVELNSIIAEMARKEEGYDQTTVEKDVEFYTSLYGGKVDDVAERLRKLNSPDSDIEDIEDQEDEDATLMQTVRPGPSASSTFAQGEQSNVVRSSFLGNLDKGEKSKESKFSGANEFPDFTEEGPPDQWGGTGVFNATSTQRISLPVQTSTSTMPTVTTTQSRQRTRAQFLPSGCPVRSHNYENNAFSAFGQPGGDQNMMFMFSQSLASQFNVQTIVGRKFDGNPEYFPEFRLLWIKADRQMESMRFPPASRFWELKKVLAGPALSYVQGLPPAADGSYKAALDLLASLYMDERSSLRMLVKNLLSLPVCGGSFKERQKLHSSIIAYKQGVEALEATPKETLLAIELSLIEARLDEQWKKDWFRFCGRRKDPDNPLGYNVTFDDLTDKLHESMIEQQKVRSAADLAPPAVKEKKEKVDRAEVFAAVAGKKTQKQTRQNNDRSGQGSEKQMQKCKLCLSGNYNEFKHTFPLNCPLVQAKSAVRLDDAKIRELVAKLKLCRNCMTDGHTAAKCDAPKQIHCRVKGCDKRHHSIFHPQQQQSAEEGC